MTVKELSAACDLEVICPADCERNVSGAYVGDLLSWVMGRASCDNAWITIMSNINIVAVAALCDTACIILAEGVTLEDEVKSAAEARGVNILSTEMGAYHTAREISL